MPITPAPRTASRTSSSRWGLMMAVTRKAIGSPRSCRCAGRSDRRPFLLGLVGVVAAVGPGEGTHATRARRRCVAHALAELHVVGDQAVLVDVEALQLAVAGDPQPADGLDPEHHGRGDGAHGDDAGQAADELGLELVDAATVEEALDRAARRVGPGGSGDAEAV